MNGQKSDSIMESHLILIRQNRTHTQKDCFTVVLAEVNLILKTDMLDIECTLFNVHSASHILKLLVLYTCGNSLGTVTTIVAIIAIDNIIVIVTRTGIRTDTVCGAGRMIVAITNRTAR
uniref:Uncharacterized protein n=1 Tax=Glossina pallidipes TaxID=7398 RepID=A0A1A9ZMU2_GLOPL